MSALLRETFPVGLLQCNCTILADTDAAEAIVIDPGDNISRIQAYLSKHNLKLKQIVVTHGHIDHVGGAVQLRKATGAPIYMNEKDLPQLAIIEQQAGWFNMLTPEVAPPDVNAVQGTGASAGKWKGQVLETPGHTEGSICVYFPEQTLLLAGDTLFAGGIGRTDFPGGNSAAIFRSLQDVVLALPDDTDVIPGHGPETVLGVERATNPFLR